MLGLILRLIRVEPAPLVLAFVIAPLFEEYLNRALLISRGDFIIFLEKPISLMFLTLSVIVLLTSLWLKRK